MYRCKKLSINLQNYSIADFKNHLISEFDVNKNKTGSIVINSARSKYDSILDNS